MIHLFLVENCPWCLWASLAWKDYARWGEPHCALSRRVEALEATLRAANRICKLRERERREAEREANRLKDALYQNVGDAYNLLTQGESPTRLRQPSAQRIYDRSKAALASVSARPEAVTPEAPTDSSK